MDHYIEIKILPDPEFSSSTLMNALFNKLHKTLFDMHIKNIGVSFPDYEKTLGQRLRLHSTSPILDSLNKLNWVGRMRDYCLISAILPVPNIVTYRTVSRQQDKLTQAKLRRLLARQEQGERRDKPLLTETDITDYQKKMVTDYQKGPYLELKSSKGQRYRRYIVLGEPTKQLVIGEFNQFGLSDTASIPWF